MKVFKYLIEENGFRNLIDMEPSPENRRERFALWILKKFAPRFTAAEVGKLKRGEPSPLTQVQAGEAWRSRMESWSPQRLEDVHVLEFTEDETIEDEITEDKTTTVGE